MNRKRILIILVVAGLAAVAAYSAGWFHHDTQLRGSGTVEARDIRVGSKVGGRIDKVLVLEGDSVEPGQVLIEFDDRELRASMAETRAAAEKAERGFRPEEIAEARAAAEQAKASMTSAGTGTAKKILTPQKPISISRLTRCEQIWIISARRPCGEGPGLQATARYRRSKLENGTGAEKKTPSTSWIIKARISARRNCFGRGPLSPDTGHAGEIRARRPRGELTPREPPWPTMNTIRERQVLAPSAATVEVLDVRPGDLIAPNTPIATLLERDQIYVRIYIPETQIGRVQLGQKAEIRVDSFANQAFAGVIEQINQQAEFLPRNVQTVEERVHQVSE